MNAATDAASQNRVTGGHGLAPSPVRLIWVHPPDCPRPECGRQLNEAMGPWKDRGDWMCHGDHDGKRIWFDYELIMILRSRLAEALKNQPNDQAHRSLPEDNAL